MVIDGNIDIDVIIVLYICASLLVLANILKAKHKPAKEHTTSIAKNNIINPSLNDIFKDSAVFAPDDTTNPSKELVAHNIPDVHIAKYLPAIIEFLFIPVAKRDSRVPLSFSPVPRSFAIADTPNKQYVIRSIGNIVRIIEPLVLTSTLLSSDLYFEAYVYGSPFSSSFSLRYVSFSPIIYSLTVATAA